MRTIGQNVNPKNTYQIISITTWPPTPRTNPTRSFSTDVVIGILNQQRPQSSANKTDCMKLSHVKSPFLAFLPLRHIKMRSCVQ